MTRADGRADDELRPVKITRNWLDHAAGSVLVEFGRTRVLCAASAAEGVPRWRKGSGLGWVTAEYAMLPASTNTRSDRESVKGRIGGRGGTEHPGPSELDQHRPGRVVEPVPGDLDRSELVVGPSISARHAPKPRGRQPHGLPHPSGW